MNLYKIKNKHYSKKASLQLDAHNQRNTTSIRTSY